MIRVDFVTLSRSDYATMRPIALSALKDPEFDVKVIAGGSHMLKRFGQTIKSIAKDGLPVSKKVNFLREKDSSDADMAAAYARAVDDFVKIFKKDAPDYIFIVGDRWEMLAVAKAATMLRIPIAHHSGGDITQGSADNQTRYALSTLSHLHFTALEDHAERLRRMGEEPWRVMVTGEPALTGIENAARTVPDIRANLGLKKNENFVLATFHPTSYDDKPLAEQIGVFIKALDLIPQNIVLTAPNPDPGSGSVYEALRQYARKNPRVSMFENLGTENYYAAMAAADFMIGNSSSGLWEAPSFNLPVINIGRRQDGRARGRNVIDVPLEIGAIENAIKKASSPEFRSSLEDRSNPYARKDSVELILSGLKTKKSRTELLAKIFVDPLKTGRL